MVLIDLSDSQKSFYMEDQITDWLGFMPVQFSLKEYEEIKKNMTQPLSQWVGKPPISWAKDDRPILLTIRDQQNIGSMTDKFNIIKGFVVGIFTFLMILVLWNAGILNGIHRYGEMGLRLAFGISFLSSFVVALAAARLPARLGSFAGGLAALRLP